MFGRALVNISFGILFGPSVFFPLDRFLRLRSKTSLVNWDAIL